MKTTVELADQIGDSVKRQLGQLANQLGRDEACKQILAELSKSHPTLDPNDLYDRFFRIVWFFEHCENRELIANKTSKSLLSMGEYMLKLLKIKPYASKFSHLFHTLYRAHSRLLSRSENPWMARWNLAIGEAHVGTIATITVDNECEDLLAEAADTFSDGDLSASLILYQNAAACAKTELETARARLGMIRCFRVFDESDTALSLVTALKQSFTLPSSMIEDLRWEKRFLLTQRDGNLDPLTQGLQAAVEGQEPPHPTYHLKAMLWCYASKKRSILDQLPRLAWIKQHIKSEDTQALETYQFIRDLEKLYDTKFSIFEKLKDAGEIIESVKKSRLTENGVVFLAAMTRWLMRSKQRRAASMVIGHYQCQSLRWSYGRKHDLFNLMSDVGDRFNLTTETSRSPNVEVSIKSGLERSILYVEIMAKIFGTAVLSKIKSFRSDSDSNIQDLFVKISAFFAKYASGAMKGPIHKLGQVVLNLIPLPAEAEKNFKSVLWSKMIVGSKTMRDILEEELGNKVEDLFDEFDWNPVGIGGVGQVYRARTKNGDDVAVKIQYPDLPRIIHQDMWVFSSIISAIRWLFPAIDTAALTKVIRTIYEHETDFSNEIKCAHALDQIPNRRWRIPKFYPELSTKRVLTAEFIEGENLYQFSENSSEQMKTEVAKAIEQFHALSILEANRICLDPHPANLIVRDGVLYMIDFGCFMDVSPAYANFFRDTVRNLANPPEERALRLTESFRRYGLLREHAEVSDADIKAFSTIVVEQFHWNLCADPTLHDRFIELFLRRGLTKVFGTSVPEFNLAYLSALMVYRTINKFGIVQPPHWDHEFSTEINARLQARLGPADPSSLSEPNSLDLQTPKAS